MPDLLKALVLGLVQGLTEFLPVSSTGHLVVFEEALDVDQHTFGLAFDASIHLGTLLALLVYFWRDLWQLLTAWLRSIAARRWNASDDSRLAWLLILGTIPAVAIGLPLEDTIDERLRDPAVVAAMLIAFSGVFIAAERLGRQSLSMRAVRAPHALLIGFAQAVALIPGVSRSGATISAGLLAGINREQAAKFAFLLSIPVVAGAGGVHAIDVLRDAGSGALEGGDLQFFAVGFAVAAVSGYLTIRFLLAFLRQHTLIPFMYYRVALAIAIFALMATGFF